MRIEKWALAAVSTLLISACANNSVWYDSDNVSNPTYESGEVLGVRISVSYYTCPAPEEFGSSCRRETRSWTPAYAREMGGYRLEEVRVYVRLNSGEEIVVVSSKDIDLQRGESVLVGFEGTSTDAETAQVVLSRP